MGAGSRGRVWEESACVSHAATRQDPNICRFQPQRCSTCDSATCSQAAALLKMQQENKREQKLDLDAMAQEAEFAAVNDKPAVCDTGKGKSKSSSSRKVTYGFHLVEGKMAHPMEDSHVAEFREVGDGNEVGLFAIFDGHSGDDVASYLREHLFHNILKEPVFWTDTMSAIRTAYHRTDRKILQKRERDEMKRSGSTAVTVILINGEKTVVANVGDSRAVISEAGEARQLSVDHEPLEEREEIERRGGFVTEMHGDVPRVDATLAMSRAFGDRSLKEHISSDPDVAVEDVGADAEFIILASDGLWKVMSNQEAVDEIRGIKEARKAAAALIGAALRRGSEDDISCIVVLLQ